MARGDLRGRSKWEAENRLQVNPWPFVVIALLVALLVGLAFLLSMVAAGR